MPKDKYKKMKQDKLKVSKFVFIFKKEKNYAIFNSLNTEVIYGGKILNKIYYNFKKYNFWGVFLNSLNDSEKKIAKRIFPLLIKLNFIIKNSASDTTKLHELQINVIKKNYVKTLYLSLTYSCNLKCKYCISNSVNNSLGNKIVNMDIKVAKAAADYYLAHVLEEGDKEIVFYGGEPVINFSLIKFFAKYINKREEQKFRKNKNYKRSRFILCTNGTLFDQEKADFLKKYNIYPTLTIDGDKKIHDQVRKFKDGRGTYDTVVKNFTLLKSCHIPVGSTLTLGRHNIKNLPKFIEEIATLYKPETMATNLIIDYSKTNNKYVISGREIADTFIEAYKTARRYGLYLVKYLMDNRIKPFVEKTPRLKGCTGTGARIMVLPDGSLSACMAFADNFKYNILDNPNFEDFIPEGIQLYSPFFKAKCLKCYALSCCGGGCPKKAENKYGTFWGLDDDYCYQSKKILEWLIWDLFYLTGEKRKKSEFLYPSISDRKKIYGKIKVFESPLDFQYSPNY